MRVSRGPAPAGRSPGRAGRRPTPCRCRCRARGSRAPAAARAPGAGRRCASFALPCSAATAPANASSSPASAAAGPSKAPRGSGPHDRVGAGALGDQRVGAGLAEEREQLGPLAPGGRRVAVRDLEHGHARHVRAGGRPAARHVRAGGGSALEVEHRRERAQAGAHVERQRALVARGERDPDAVARQRLREQPPPDPPPEPVAGDEQVGEVRDAAVAHDAGEARDRAVLVRDPDPALAQLEVELVGPAAPLAEVAVARRDRAHAVDVLRARALDPHPRSFPADGYARR